MPDDRPLYTDRVLVTDDDKRRILDLDDTNLVPPPVGIFDEPTRCYRINEQWAAIVMGMVNWLAHPAVWRDAVDWDYPAIQQINAFKVGEDCDMLEELQFRQSPNELCVLEYSIDGGQSWTAYADILICVTQGLIENYMQTAFNTNTTLISQIQQLAETAPVNDLPAQPTQTEPDELCNAVYYIVDQIIDFIDETITDASTITLQEFLEGLLGLGGWEASLLKAFWDLIVANSYPDLLTDVQASRDAVAAHFYCSEIDRDTVISAIDGDVTISDPAQAAWIGAINATTDAKIALWAFVGSQTDSGESCSGFVCGDWQSVLDLTVDDYGFVFGKDDSNNDTGIWASGVGLVAVPVTIGSTRRFLFGSWLFDETQVTSYRIEGTYTRGTYPSWAYSYGAFYTAWYNNDTQLPTGKWYVTYENLPTGAQTLDVTMDGYELIVDELELFFRPAYYNYTNGAVTITKVTIEGNGPKPSQLP